MDYYKNKNNAVVIKFLKEYGIYYNGCFEWHEIKIVLCSLIRDNNINDLKEVLKELSENHRYDKEDELNKPFKSTNEYIINLLEYYKNQIKISKSKFDLVLKKEKENKFSSLINFIINDVYSKCTSSDGARTTTTPLHIACSYGYKEIIKILIDYGANPNLKNSQGLTPLAEMYNGYHKELIVFLINNGANVYEVDNDGNTVLHRAIRQWNEDAIKILHHNYNININRKKS